MRSKRLPCIALFGVCALAVAPGPVRASRAMAAIVGYVAARRGAWGRGGSRVRGGKRGRGRRPGGTRDTWRAWLLGSCILVTMAIQLGPFPYEAVCVSAHVLFWDLPSEFHPWVFATVTRVRFGTWEYLLSTVSALQWIAYTMNRIRIQSELKNGNGQNPVGGFLITFFDIYI